MGGTTPGLSFGATGTVATDARRQVAHEQLWKACHAGPLRMSVRFCVQGKARVVARPQPLCGLYPPASANAARPVPRRQPQGPCRP